MAQYSFVSLSEFTGETQLHEHDDLDEAVAEREDASHEKFVEVSPVMGQCATHGWTEYSTQGCEACLSDWVLASEC